MGTPAKVEKRAEYPLYEMEEKGSLILPPHIISQITFLHARCGNTEWSGMLLYDVLKGNPSKPEDFKLEAKHIFLMDIGTAGSTSYETDGDIVDLFDEIPEAMEMKLGHIHTHHSGKAYFSGVDMSELQDNVDKHNYYLSLVVSFDGNYAAKVVFLSDMHITSKMNFIDDAGQTKHFKKATMEKHMVVINMKIMYSEMGGFFSTRLDTIVKKADAEKKKAQAWKYPGYQGGYNQHHTSWNSEKQRHLPAHRPINSKIIPDKMTSWEIEGLTKNILMFDTDLKTESNVYKILHDIANQMSDDETASDLYYDYLLNHIEKVIDSYFDQQLEPDEYITVIKEVIMCIKKYEGLPILADVVRNLEETFDHFILGYDSSDDDNDDEKSIADQLEKMEREMR